MLALADDKFLIIWYLQTKKVCFKHANSTRNGNVAVISLFDGTLAAKDQKVDLAAICYNVKLKIHRYQYSDLYELTVIHARLRPHNCSVYAGCSSFPNKLET